MKRVWQELRPFRWIAALWIAYGIAHVVLAQLSAHRGILSPDGDVDRGYAIFAIAVLALRVVTLIFVPLVVAYKLVMRVARALGDRAKSSG